MLLFFGTKCTEFYLIFTAIKLIITFDELCEKNEADMNQARYYVQLVSPPANANFSGADSYVLVRDDRQSTVAAIDAVSFNTDRLVKNQSYVGVYRCEKASPFFYKAAADPYGPSIYQQLFAWRYVGIILLFVHLLLVLYHTLVNVMHRTSQRFNRIFAVLGLVIWSIIALWIILQLITWGSKFNGQAVSPTLPSEFMEFLDLYFEYIYLIYTADFVVLIKADELLANVSLVPDCINVDSDDDEDDEGYVTIHYEEPNIPALEIPTENNGDLSWNIIQALDSKIIRLTIQYKEKRKVLKLVNGIIKEPKDGWKSCKVFALVEKNAETNDQEAIRSRASSRLSSISTQNEDSPGLQNAVDVASSIIANPTNVSAKLSNPNSTTSSFPQLACLAKPIDSNKENSMPENVHDSLITTEDSVSHCDVSGVSKIKVETEKALVPHPAEPDLVKLEADEPDIIADRLIKNQSHVQLASPSPMANLSGADPYVLVEENRRPTAAAIDAVTQQPTAPVVVLTKEDELGNEETGKYSFQMKSNQIQHTDRLIKNQNLTLDTPTLFAYKNEK